MINFNNVNWYDQVMMESGLLGNVTTITQNGITFLDNVSCAKVSIDIALNSQDKNTGNYSG